MRTGAILVVSSITVLAEVPLFCGGPGPAHYRQDVFQARHLEEALALQIKANMCICAFSAVGD